MSLTNTGLIDAWLNDFRVALRPARPIKWLADQLWTAAFLAAKLAKGKS